MTNIMEVYICVDVETSGPIPGDYSLLSIGACTLFNPRQTFYVELQPTSMNATDEAAAVHKLSLQRLAKEGLPPEAAMTQFEAWLRDQTQDNQVPVFVAFNAAFDWMFINYYFMHYLGHNPFGHAALDIKALYMGLSGSSWARTSWRFIDPKYKAVQNEPDEQQLSHHALQDALDQADLFTKMLEELHPNNKRR